MRSHEAMVRSKPSWGSVAMLYEICLLIFGLGSVVARAAFGPRFEARTDYRVGDHLQSVVAADFDGDGDLDMATANSGSHNVTVCLKGGDCTMDSSSLINRTDLLPACPITITGDTNASADVSAVDLLVHGKYTFQGGTALQPCEASGDVDCSGDVRPLDLVKLVNHVFKGGPAPYDVCTRVGVEWDCTP